MNRSSIPRTKGLIFGMKASILWTTGAILADGRINPRMKGLIFGMKSPIFGMNGLIFGDEGRHPPDERPHLRDEGKSDLSSPRSDRPGAL
jgi:hypothetical protein